MPADPLNSELVNSLVVRALARPAEERHSYVCDACRGDPALLEQVLKYVQAEERMKGFLMSPLIKRDDPRINSTVAATTPNGGSAFTSGTVLAQRYRIVNLLGRGGMGEVYRADDLLLELAVAIKFLPLATTADTGAINRFRNEVRMARRVTHPNVCRVYDIGEAEGLAFLTMEYVDGEDLASLLRRIGKFSTEKGLEIARKLCAGLAAAHERGVIHRDLKPANIMLDGRGHVRIMDFGIAGLAEQIRDFHSGTPAYMSPEQLAGRVVTPRSDIYSLGIVLHELFTGKRPPLPPGTADLDPAIERVIRSCLEPDPQVRPATPLAVAAALPGGDPLAAALAAGETPAPELVAQAGSVEGLRPWVAVACLAVVIIGLGLLSILRQGSDLINQIPMENSSEVLAAKARELAKSFGYTERPVDTRFAWDYDADYLGYLGKQKNVSARDPRLHAPHPPVVFFWYRQSALYARVVNFDDEGVAFRRETLEPDTQAVVFDSEGRLVEFEVRLPVEVGRSANAVFEWDRLFVAAGLDPTRFQEVQAELTPAAPFDARAAWTGSWDAGAGKSLRVEAAAYRGRPVFFRVLGPWTAPDKPPPVTLYAFSLPIFVGVFTVLPTVCGFLAWRNSRSGRSDRRGAFRLAVFAFGCSVLLSLTTGHHVAAATEFVRWFAALRQAVGLGVLFWVLYMAFEPQVRRRSPEVLISWTRLLAGQFRDPMTGGHVLAGIAFGVGSLCVLQAVTPTFRSASLTGGLPLLLGSSASALLAVLLSRALIGVGAGLMYMFSLNLITASVRLRWLAVSIFIALNTLLFTTGYDTGPFLAILRSVIFFGMVATTLLRFGVLSAATAVYTGTTLLLLPLTTNWTAWYAQDALLGLVPLVALATYGFFATLAGRRPWPKTAPG